MAVVCVCVLCNPAIHLQHREKVAINWGTIFFALKAICISKGGVRRVEDSPQIGSKLARTAVTLCSGSSTGSFWNWGVRLDGGKWVFIHSLDYRRELIACRHSLCLVPHYVWGFCFIFISQFTNSTVEDFAGRVRMGVLIVFATLFDRL